MPYLRPSLAAAAVLIAIGMLGACSAEAPPGPRTSNESPSAQTAAAGDASCAFIIRFRGHSYEAVALAVEPVPGEILGQAVLPGCNDTGQTSPPPDEQVKVAAFPGLDPGVALVWADAPDRVFVRQGLDELPPEVAALVHPPVCDPADVPIGLRGPWLGILGADGKTELDLIPPYDLTLRVDRASAPGYERAHLEIRVPPSLGTPLTHHDIASSLLEGGTIRIVATCDGDRFVAQSVEAFPPS